MLQNINLFLHIFCGIVAILVGIFPYFTQKGGRNHALSGRLFLALMGVVIFTAFAGVLFFRDRPFLTIVTLLSTYTSYSGYRVLKTKDRGFERQDVTFMLFVLSMTLYFIFRFQTANVVWHISVVYYLIAYVFLIVGFDLLRYFFPKITPQKGFWLYEHIYKMTSSFSALISAGAGSLLVAYEPYNQIIPAIFGTVWLIFSLVYFPIKMKRKKKLVTA
ncbi:MAG: hypothetical protein AAF960_19040 [Bacteroidota bacterium]